MKKHLLYIVAIVSMSFALVNCGSSGGGNNSSPAAAAATNYGTSCGNNMVNSPWGCKQSCGVNMAYDTNNNCSAYTPGTATGVGGVNGVNPPMCQMSCPVGQVSVQGGHCLPQGQCATCYGQYGNNCYQGDGSYNYYGY